MSAMKRRIEKKRKPSGGEKSFDACPKWKRPFVVLSSPLLRKLVLVVVVVILVCWSVDRWSGVVKEGMFSSWSSVLSFLGVGGLVVIIAAAGTIIWASRRERFAAAWERFKGTFKHANRYLCGICFAAAVWGLLAFFYPGEGTLGVASLGGDVGTWIIGAPDAGGGLRIAGLIFLGFVFLFPGQIGRGLAKGFHFLGKKAGHIFVPASRPGYRRRATPLAGGPRVMSHGAVSSGNVSQKDISGGEEKSGGYQEEVGGEKGGEVPAFAGVQAAMQGYVEQGGVSREPILTASGWQLPPVDMLDEPKELELDKEDVVKRAQVIEQALASYGVECKVVQTNMGPTVTQFGVEPGWHRKYKKIKTTDRDGVVHMKVEEVSKTRIRVDKIAALSNDLALALAAPSIRVEAPVPGKAMVGIEVPNMVFGSVSLRSVIETTAFQKIKARSPLALALGKGAGGEAVASNLAKMPHLLIAGSTGSGKTVCLDSLICCLLLHNTPDDVRFIMIDPKRVELVSFNGIPHLATPVIVDADKAVKALRWLWREMDNRYRLLAQSRERNIDSYNKERSAGEKMPYMVLIIDELADLMMSAFDEVEHTLCRLAQQARAVGIHLVVATQRPSVDVITGLIKANFPTRISFAVTSQIDSRTILDTVGAEKLLGKGDMLYLPTEASKPRRLQGTFISDGEIERLVYFWGGQHGLQRDFIDLDDMREPVSTQSKVTPAADSLMAEARELAQAHGQISSSFLQRRLRIGYPRAARLMEALEQEGFGRGGVMPGDKETGEL